MDRKLGRKKDNRNHLVRNLMTSLVLYEKIVTTEAKAKTLKGEIDRLISNAKSQESLTARRNLIKVLYDSNAVKKTMEVLVPRYAERKSGFTRLFRLGVRVGDGAPKFQIELIQEDEAKEKTKETLKINKKSAEGSVEEKATEKIEGKIEGKDE